MTALAADMEALRDKLMDREMSEAAARATSKGRGMRRATAGNIWVVAFEEKLTKAVAAHARLVDICAFTEADATKAQACFENR